MVHIGVVDIKEKSTALVVIVELDMTMQQGTGLQDAPAIVRQAHALFPSRFVTARRGRLTGTANPILIAKSGTASRFEVPLRGCAAHQRTNGRKASTYLHIQ